ncbi:MAG TPA: tetratricopeptide repeat protein [Rubrivivax sp.]|nr:tetratricopeptide repeat protein [Rubrivivax sp.]
MAAYQRGDVVAAMSVLRGAARAGHAPSQVLLAFILDRADFAEDAFALYRDAAAQGDAEGDFNLGNAYLLGRGIAKDEKRALQHFSKAADAGHAGAVVLIAEWTAKDHPLLADRPPAQALAAVRRAAEAGHLPSMETLAQAYRTGRWQLSVDSQLAMDWQARATTLRAQRAAVKPPPPPKAAS